MMVLCSYMYWMSKSDPRNARGWVGRKNACQDWQSCYLYFIQFWQAFYIWVDLYVIIIIVSAAYKNQFQLLFFIATWNCQKITQAFYFFLGDFRAEFFSSRANWSFKVYIFTLHFHFLLFLIIWGVIITKAWLSFFWKFYLLMTICLIPLITISLIYLTEYQCQILVKYQVEPCL